MLKHYCALLLPLLSVLLCEVVTFAFQNEFTFFTCLWSDWHFIICIRASILTLLTFARPLERWMFQLESHKAHTIVPHSLNLTTNNRGFIIFEMWSLIFCINSQRICFLSYTWKISFTRQHPAAIKLKAYNCFALIICLSSLLGLSVVYGSDRVCQFAFKHTHYWRASASSPRSDLTAGIRLQFWGRRERKQCLILMMIIRQSKTFWFTIIKKKFYDRHSKGSKREN